MSFVAKYQGRHVRVNERNSQALAQCDFSDFTYQKKDLVRQMRWSGNSLVWTGWLVGHDQVDVPNMLDRPPPVKADPYPVRDPRLPQPSGPVSESPYAPTAQIIDVLDEFYWTSEVVGPLPVSPIVPPMNPDGTPIGVSTQVLTEQLNKFHWGS